ncbi:MAG TPA: hydrogenase maturation protease [Polyangiaceae bacterium]|jgi:hydrogenase maturation protease|nr:hydrogenase maturation protease [Polyangiaceae bacterium]
MTSPRILVAGIGNVFMGDDGFGVEVVRKRAERPLPDGVTLMDAGIRGIDLTYALLDGYDAAVLVDATPRGRAPGTLYVLEPTVASALEASLFDAHDMNPVRVLAAAKALGATPPVVRVLGCEPARLGTLDEPLFELSAEVTSAVEPALELLDELLDELRRPAKATTTEHAHA